MYFKIKIILLIEILDEIMSFVEYKSNNGFSIKGSCHIRSTEFLWENAFLNTFQEDNPPTPNLIPCTENSNVHAMV